MCISNVFVTTSETSEIPVWEILSIVVLCDGSVEVLSASELTVVVPGGAVNLVFESVWKVTVSLENFKVDVSSAIFKVVNSLVVLEGSVVVEIILITSVSVVMGNCVSVKIETLEGDA